VVKDLGGGAVTHYLFDLSGTLIAEADGTDATTREYIHIDGPPIGLMEGTTLYVVHPDHLGVPRASGRLRKRNRRRRWAGGDVTEAQVWG